MALSKAGKLPEPRFQGSSPRETPAVRKPDSMAKGSELGCNHSFYDEEDCIDRRKGRMSKSSLYRENYNSIHLEIVELLKAARSASARSINALMTATYWAIGRRILQAEQQGPARAGYGKQLVEQLARDLVKQFGRGFSQPNLWKMRAFYFGMAREKDSLDTVKRIFKAPFIQ
jgi:DUF1016 N-terminal domain